MLTIYKIKSVCSKTSIFLLLGVFLFALFSSMAQRQVYAASDTTINLIDPFSYIQSTNQTEPSSDTSAMPGLNGTGSLMACSMSFEKTTETDSFLTNTLGVTSSDLSPGSTGTSNWQLPALSGYDTKNSTFFPNLTSAQADYIYGNVNKSIPIIQLVGNGGANSADCSNDVLMPVGTNQYEGLQFCAVYGQSGTASTLGTGQSCTNSLSAMPQGETYMTVPMTFILASANTGSSTGKSYYYDNGRNGKNVTYESSSVTVANTPSGGPSTNSSGTGAIGPNATPSGPTTSSSSGTSGPTCQASGVLDWVYCAVYDSLKGITDLVLNDLIIPELNTNPICISPTGSGCKIKNDPTYAIWSSFRVYGDVILLIALLVIIISEAMGGGLLDAYSVRKMLPRLLAAGILLNLSIYIVAALVDITNIIGKGIFQIIVAPLKNAGAFKVASNTSGNLLLVAGISFAGLLSLRHLGTAFATHQGFSMLVDVIIVPALLVFLAILVTVIIRKVAILALIILSPLAFTFYVLPNTEKWFKKWWSLLLEMLMVFPIIMVMFAVSSVMSVISSLPGAQPGGVQDGINSLLTLAFIILPLILVPFSFKLAGDTIGRIHGAIDGARAKISAMHEPRRKRAMQNYSIRHAGDRERTIMRREAQGVGIGRFRINNSTIGNLPVIGRGYMNAQNRARQRYTEATAQVSQMPGWKHIEHDADAQWAGTNVNPRDALAFMIPRLQQTVRQQHTKADGTLEDGWDDNRIDREANRQARDAVSRFGQAVGFGQAQSRLAARQLVINGTDIKDGEEINDLIARVGGSDASMRGALHGEFNALTKQVGRHDLALGNAVFAKTTDLQARINRGEDDQNGTLATQLAAALKEGMENAWASASLYQHANDKPQNIENAIKHFGSLLSSNNAEDQNKALVFMQELRAMQPNATGDVRDRINKFLSDPNVINTENNLRTNLQQTNVQPVLDANGNQKMVERVEYITDDPADPSKITGKRLVREPARGMSDYDRLMQRSRTYSQLPEDVRAAQANQNNPPGTPPGNPPGTPPGP